MPEVCQEWQICASVSTVIFYQILELFLQCGIYFLLLLFSLLCSYVNMPTIKQKYPEKQVNERQRIPKGQSKMDNPEKMATQVTQYEGEKTTQYVLDTTMRKQT